MTTDLITVEPQLPVSQRELARLLEDYQPPQIVIAGEFASFAYVEFFTAGLKSESRRTKLAYRRNVDRFLAWLSDRQLTLREVSSPVVAEYLENHLNKENGQALAPSSKKQHLAAIRKFFKHQERRHGVIFNPAAAVEGPKLVVTEGVTRPLPP